MGVIVAYDVTIHAHMLHPPPQFNGVSGPSIGTIVATYKPPQNPDDLHMPTFSNHVQREQAIIV